MNNDADNRKRNLPLRRELRARSTDGETLLWQVLRDRRLCGLKFRRQHSIDSYIVDFACLERRVIVEVDGGYHEAVFDQDKQRQEDLEKKGWKVIRLNNDDVMEDVEAAAIAIAREVGIEPDFLD